MERKIGEIFEYQGEWYQCVNTGFSCADCDIKGDCSDEHIGACTGSLRTDGKKVRFKKLEKVGAPVKINGALMQKMKTPVAIGCEQCVLNNNGCSIAYEKCFSNELYVMEQNQEDMEEKYSELTYIVHEYMDKDMTYKDFKEAINYWVDDYNKLNKETDKLTLKPFDLEAAKLGKPVCTRDGRKARIICFDAKGDKPIIALVEAKGNKDALIEEVERYFINGHSVFEVRGTNNDLMMLPEKKEGWVNIYKTGNDKFAALVGSDYLYKTEKEAKIEADPSFLATVKIEWEE